MFTKTHHLNFVKMWMMKSCLFNFSPVENKCNTPCYCGINDYFREISYKSLLVYESEYVERMIGLFFFSCDGSIQGQQE